MEGERDGGRGIMRSTPEPLQLGGLVGGRGNGERQARAWVLAIGASCRSPSTHHSYKWNFAYEHERPLLTQMELRVQVWAPAICASGAACAHACPILAWHPVVGHSPGLGTPARESMRKPRIERRGLGSCRYWMSFKSCDWILVGMGAVPFCYPPIFFRRHLITCFHSWNSLNPLNIK